MRPHIFDSTLENTLFCFLKLKYKDVLNIIYKDIISC